MPINVERLTTIKYNIDVEEVNDHYEYLNVYLKTTINVERLTTVS